VTTPPSGWSRSRICMVLLAIACLLPSAYMAWAWRDMPRLGNGHDDSVYWLNAKSLAQGQGYRITSLPGQPWQTKYPPLLPLYFSLVWRIAPQFPANLPLATLFCWLLVPAWLALAYRALRDMGLERGPALVICFVMAANPLTIEFALSTGAETMFSVLWMASVALTYRCRSGRVAAAAGVLAGLAYLTKSAALPLLCVCPLYFAARRQYAHALTFAAGMLPAVAGWNLWIRGHMGHPADPLLIYYTDYFRYHLYNVDFRMLPSLLLKNTDALLRSVGHLLIGPPSFLSMDSAGVMAAVRLGIEIIGIVTVAGCIRVRHRGLTPYHAFAGLYVLLLLVWHYPPDERFLFPIFPVLVAGCWQEIHALHGLLPKPKLIHAIPAGLAAAVCVWIALGWHHSFQFLGEIRAIDRNNCAVYDWIERNTPPDATFLAYDDIMLHLYTGRRGYRPVVPTRFFYQGDELAARQYLGSLPELARKHGLTYILAGPRDWHGEILPGGLAQRSHQMLAAAHLPVVLRSESVVLFQVDGAPAPAPVAP
jgi:hypothetical protein